MLFIANNFAKVWTLWSAIIGTASYAHGFLCYEGNEPPSEEIWEEMHA